jgi:hypothetical protein
LRSGQRSAGDGSMTKSGGKPGHFRLVLRSRPWKASRSWRVFSYMKAGQLARPCIQLSVRGRPGRASLSRPCGPLKSVDATYRPCVHHGRQAQRRLPRRSSRRSPPVSLARLRQLVDQLIREQVPTTAVVCIMGVFEIHLRLKPARITWPHEQGHGPDTCPALADGRPMGPFVFKHQGSGVGSAFPQSAIGPQPGP